MQDFDRQKIADFKRRFMPSQLPDEVRASGNFKVGSEVNYQQELQMEHQQNQRSASGGASRYHHSQQMQVAQGGTKMRGEGQADGSDKQKYGTGSGIQARLEGAAAASGLHGQTTASAL